MKIKKRNYWSFFKLKIAGMVYIEYGGKMHFPKLKSDIFVNFFSSCVEIPQLSQVGSKSTETSRCHTLHIFYFDQAKYYFDKTKYYFEKTKNCFVKTNCYFDKTKYYFDRTKYCFDKTNFYFDKMKYYFDKTKYYFVKTNCYFDKTK